MLEVALHNPRQHKQVCCDSGPLVFARANRDAGLWTTVDQCEVDSDARIEIVPERAEVSLAVTGRDAEYLGLPANFTVGDTRFEITIAKSGASHRPLQQLRTGKRNSRNQQTTAGPSPATLSHWFAALSSLNHWATSLQELYVQAAQCAVEAIGLDGGIVLRRRDGEWEIAASCLPHPELGIHYDVTVLDELSKSPQTLFHGSAEYTPLTPREEICSRSEQITLGEPAIVVSPLRNASGELAGAVYGYRSVREGNARRTIRYLEAHMIELLAGAVSEGITRIEREAETDRRRVLLEQAAATSQNQSACKIVTGEREVTLLFADLRNSTALSAALEPNETYELLSHLMECLTAAVIDHDGLVIDYYGDGLAAMWNAPADQSDHPELACRAALRMLQTLPSVSSDWIDVLPGELQIGIGIHTGRAHVGNTGTHRRSKYGPRGTTVNLTSRIETATKQFDLPLLATGDVAKRLSNRFATHRVCNARVSGFDRPIELYTVCAGKSDDRTSTEWRDYHQALQYFEQGRLQEAAEQLSAMEPGLREVPSRFLSNHLNRVLARQNRRRSTDRGSDPACGLITLRSK